MKEIESLFPVPLYKTSLNVDLKSIKKHISKIAKQYNFDSYTSRIFNWGTFNQKDFNEHNIFDIKHPEHEKLLNIINKDYRYDKHDWGNLTDFIK